MSKAKLIWRRYHANSLNSFFRVLRKSIPWALPIICVIYLFFTQMAFLSLWFGTIEVTSAFKSFSNFKVFMNMIAFYQVADYTIGMITLTLVLIYFPLGYLAFIFISFINDIIYHALLNENPSQQYNFKHYSWFFKRS